MSHPPSKPDLAEKLEQIWAEYAEGRAWALGSPPPELVGLMLAALDNAMRQTLTALAASHREQLSGKIGQLSTAESITLTGCNRGGKLHFPPECASPPAPPLYTAAQVQERVDQALAEMDEKQGCLDKLAEIARAKAVSEAVAKEREAVITRLELRKEFYEVMEEWFRSIGAPEDAARSPEHAVATSYAATDIRTGSHVDAGHAAALRALIDKRRAEIRSRGGEG